MDGFAFTWICFCGVLEPGTCMSMPTAMLRRRAMLVAPLRVRSASSASERSLV